ncbi:MAG: hypothetical protein R3E04_09500 [Sphingobium sp.]
MNRIKAEATISPEALARLDHPSAIRFIRLGQGGCWAREAFEAGIIPFKYRNVSHGPCMAGDWDTVRREIAASGRKPGAIGGDIRELQDFYDSDDQCLWVTFAEGHLWWTFGEGSVLPVNDPGDDRPARMRRTLDGWHCQDVKGTPLRLQSLSSALTKVGGFRRTTCPIDQRDYLLRKVRGEEEPLVLEARELGMKLDDLAVRMIAQLDWRDFEIMVDLIFARGGWQRQSAVGDGEVDHDLYLVSPITSETAFVQVKSSATQRVLNDYCRRFAQSGADRFFFICHSPKDALVLPDEALMSDAGLWIGLDLARKALSAGLFNWLVDRVR